jgi:iron-sulfur cluster insertion protein
MDSISITPSAATRIQDILIDEGQPASALRVFVQGGGCSGFQYGFSLEDTIAEDDVEITVDAIRVVVDMMSMQYLQGSTIDYVETLMGSNFSITNPNSVSTCGCGSSFSV